MMQKPCNDAQKQMQAEGFDNFHFHAVLSVWGLDLVNGVWTINMLKERKHIWSLFWFQRAEEAGVMFSNHIYLQKDIVCALYILKYVTRTENNVYVSLQRQPNMLEHMLCHSEYQREKIPTRRVLVLFSTFSIVPSGWVELKMIFFVATSAEPAWAYALS